MGTNYAKWEDYKKELENIKNFCEKQNQDWVFCMSGIEGSGKSTLAIKTAKILNPDFNPREQIANDFKSYINLCRKYRNKKGKVILFDEAVKAFFSREFMDQANRALVKMFISNRSFQQFNILTIPDFHYLDKYIRNFRLKTLNVAWIKWNVKDRRFFAHYSRKRYANLLFAKDSRRYMITPSDLHKCVQPNFVCPFKPLPAKEWAVYKKVKEQEQEKLLDEAMEIAQKLEDKRQIGFHRNTPLNKFLRWLQANYGYKDTADKSYLKFTYEKAASKAMTHKTNITYLVNRLLDKGYIHRLGRREYMILQQGEDLLKPEGGGEE